MGLISQMFMAKSALFSFQRKAQVVANNIANSQTLAFQRREVQMESQFPLLLSSVIAESETESLSPQNRRRRYVEYGQGVRIAEIVKDQSQGTVSVTNQPLDLAIEGKGYFVFTLSDGQLAYGRAGNFQKNNDGYMVDVNGNLLEPPMRIPDTTSDIRINEEGEVLVRVRTETNFRQIGQIRIATFQNEAGLLDVGQNLYQDTYASGDPIVDVPGRDGHGMVRERSLEYSNVNIVAEMFEMVIAQRAFEMLWKAVAAGDNLAKNVMEIPRG